MGVVALLLAFVSCTNDISEVHSNELKQIVMTASDFETENGSRTNFQITNAGAEFSWAANDTVGIFPNTGAQAYFPMTSGTGTKSAKFDGGGWALKNASTYGSYYPFIADFYLNKHAIPVDYTGQVQTGDASTAHLGACDFMAAAAVSPKNGNVTFVFKHLGALIQLKLTLPQATTLKSVALTAADDVFSVKGKVDIMASTLGIEPVASANELTLTLKDVATTEANQVVTLYMMIPPTDMSGKTLKAVLRSDKGNVEVDLASKNFKAGTAYALSGTVETENPTGDGSYKIVHVQTAGTLENLLNNEELNAIEKLHITGNLSVFDYEFIKSMSNLKTIDLSGITNESIPASAFSSSTVSMVVLPSNLKSIGEKAFYKSNITSIEFPRTLIKIGASAFEDTKALVGNIIIPDNVETIGNRAFYSSSFDGVLKLGVNVKTIGFSAFANCSNAKGDIVIPDNVIELGESVFEDSAFDGSVSIGVGLYEIPSYAFRNCEFLNGRLTLGEGLTAIGSQAFRGCKSLTGNLIIPESVTYISNYAFCNCVGFKGYLVLGSNINEIGYYAFTTEPIREEETITVNAHNYKIRHEEVNCLNFSTIYSKSTTPPKITKNVLRTMLSTTVYDTYYTTFGGYDYTNYSAGSYCLDLSGTQPQLLIVPTGSVSLYRYANGWNKIKTYQEIDF